MAEAFNIGRFTGISFSDDTVQETAAQAIHVTVDDTPTHAGQLLISQPGNETAIWADPQVQGLYAEGSSISDPPAYSAPTTICPIYIGGKNPTGDLLGISVDADGYLEVSNAVLNDLTFTQYGSPAVEALNVYVVNEAGSSGNPAAGLTGSPVPTYADYIGFEDDSSNLIGVSATNPLPVVGSFAAPTGTQTVTVAGTSTVTIAGIAAGTVQVAGTSTVTVAGNVAVTGQLTAPTGTQTVEVAGIVGTSTVTVAGNVAVASVAGTSTVTVAGNIAVASVAGTSTVEVAGIVGTSTVVVAGTSTVAVAGTSTVEVAGIVGTSTVEVAGIIGTSTVTVAGSITVAGGVIGAVPVPTQVYQTPSTGTPWTTATAVNSTQTLFNGQNISPTIINVQLDTSNSIFTTGAISFQVTGDGINWITIPTQLIIDPTSYGPISLPYTLVTNTMRNFLLLVAGYQGIRIILTAAITGTSSPTVTPYWNAVSLSHVVAPIGIYESGPTTLNSGQSSSLQLDSAANLKVNVAAGTVAVTGQLTAPTNTQTVTVAGISTVEVAGIVGTSTVTVAGSVAVAGTSTVEVAGIVGTSTVTVAGNVSVTGQLTAPTGTQTVQVAGISAGTVAVAGTSTVEVAGIVGTSTVAVTGQIAGPVAAGTAASSSVLTGQVYNSTAPALTTGQQVAEQCDAAGSIFVHPFRRSQLVMSTATVTGTTAVTLVANPGASTYADILSLMGGFQITSTATLVAQAIVGTLIISDGTISYSVPITSAYSPFNICLEAPIPATNASSNLVRGFKSSSNRKPYS